MFQVKCHLYCKRKTFITTITTGVHPISAFNMFIIIWWGVRQVFHLKNCFVLFFCLCFFDSVGILIKGLCPVEKKRKKKIYFCNFARQKTKQQNSVWFCLNEVQFSVLLERLLIFLFWILATLISFPKKHFSAIFSLRDICEWILGLCKLNCLTYCWNLIKSLYKKNISKIFSFFSLWWLHH